VCGIAGVYNFKEKAEIGWIKSMTDTLKNRGPDDEGFLAVNTEIDTIQHLTGPDSAIAGPSIETFNEPVNLLLGHRRLSILDTSPLGHQPMSNKDRTLWVMHNGEIYNFLELREELKSLGHQFRTNSDTEVLVTAYEEWDEKCLGKLNGMWAFVIYDRRKNALFVARDRFGVKPFYYYHDNDYFAFASEIKALIKLPFIEKQINPRAVYDYLVLNLNEHEEEGFFKDIFELQPSHAFYYDLSTHTMKKWKYYSLSYIDSWGKFDQEQFKQYANRTRELLFNAVSLRLRSDVPVGTCLSGGIDSSAIVCLINMMFKENKMDQLGDKQKVFTVGNHLQSIDETKWAKTVVDQTKTSWFQTFPNSDQFIKDLENLVYTQDIPFGSTSLYAQYRVMKLAKENGIKVLLDGQGGDELFTGYQTCYGTLYAEILKALAWVDLYRELKGIQNSPINKKYLLLSLVRQFGIRFAPISLITSALKFRKRENKYLTDDFFVENRYRVEEVKEIVSMSLNKMLHQYICGLSLKPLLRYEDRNSMRFSIEARTPFADDINLIEYVFQIPSIYKIYSGWSKYVLREATKGILPESIRQRKDKIGFATPEYIWLNEKKEEFRSYMSSDIDNFFNVKKIQNDWDELLGSQSKTGITNIWRFINLAVWKKVYVV
jgi:asparagine synthase (glutamine-hydrolysing)